MNMTPCPFMARCGFVTEDCTQARSVSCDVIKKTAPPPPPKPWDPKEPVAVAMTRKEWLGIIGWLKYGADWNHARMTWWRECCADRKMGAATAAEYEAAMKEAENLCKIIEEAIYG